jgi:hypothetical protein
MCGIFSHKATTTVEVSTVADMTKSELVRQYFESYKDSGFTIQMTEVEKEIDEILRIAEEFGAGTVLEFRAGTFMERK